jgi:hypothetical protein
LRRRVVVERHLVDEDILRFDVAVDYATCVAVSERGSELHDDQTRVRLGHER